MSHPQNSIRFFFCARSENHGSNVCIQVGEPCSMKYFPPPCGVHMVFVREKTDGFTLVVFFASRLERDGMICVINECQVVTTGSPPELLDYSILH